ncbi:hypothetical protein HY490_05460 [Candidatus Woesearchaeota archaeon]|nr:hypothetical protein [Candidatus Woesearchaeota archaeon]
MKHNHKHNSCMTNCDHNIIHMLAMKLDALYRYDTYVKDATKERHKECSALFERMRERDCADVEELRRILYKKCR